MRTRKGQNVTTAPLSFISNLWRKNDPDAQPNNSAGIILLFVAMISFSLMDAVAKYLTQDYPPVQIIWARYFGNLVILLLLLRGRSVPALRSRQPMIQIGRAVTQLGSLALFIYALQTIGLAEATAIMDINPVLITLMAALFLGEKIGPRRIAGIIAALIGAMIIIRPGLGVFQPAALLPLIGAFSFAAGAVMTRMARFDSIQTSMLWAIGLGTIATSFLLPFYWTPIAAKHIWAFLIIGVFGTIGQALLIRAYTVAEASAIAPFGYTGLIWAGFWGWLFFSNIPDLWTIIGAGLIVAAGLYIWAREMKINRNTAKQKMTDIHE